MTPEINEARRLMSLGYRRTSANFGILSRIDDPAWRDVMARKLAPWSMDEGQALVCSMGASAEDHYRRVYSKDKIRVSKAVSRHVTCSG